MGVTASACNSVRQKEEVNPRTLVRVPSRARLADLLKPASKLNVDGDAAQRSASGTPVAELARLYITSGQKLVQHEPTFDPRVHAYRVQVPNDCEFVVVTPVPYDLLAKVAVEVNGSPATQVIDEYLQQILFPHAALTNEVSPPHAMLDSFLCDPLLSGADAPARNANVIKINVTTDQGLSIQYTLEVERKEWSPNGWQDQEGSFYQLFHSVQALSGDSSEHRLRRQKLRWYTLGAELGSPEAQFHVALMYGGEDGFVEVRSDGRDYLDFSEEDALARRKVEVMAKFRAAQEEKAERLRQIAAYNPQDPNAQPVPPFDESIFEKLELENEQIDNEVRTLESLWVRMDASEAALLHFKWLLVAANNEHMEAQMKLARIFFSENVPKQWLEDPQVKELREKKTQQEAPDEAGEDGEAKTARGEVNLKKEAGEWYKRAALRGNLDACAILGQMYMEGIGYRCNFRKAIYWFIQSGKPQEEAEIEVANYYRKLAESGVGDAKAALQLAQMSIDGVGVPMNFDRATFLFRRAGKSEEFAKTQIERKLNTLRPRFKELFDAHDHDKDGDIDKQEFVGFYRDCLMAKGLDSERANDEAISSYQGVMKCDVAFKAYDINGDGTISFDEIWTNRHKISNLIPKTEKHYLTAVKFFSTWRMEIDRKQTMTGSSQSEPENVRLYRLQTEFQLYREVDRMSTRSLTRIPTVAVNDQGVKTERTQTISRAPTTNTASQRNLNRARTKSQGGQY